MWMCSPDGNGIAPRLSLHRSPVLVCRSTTTRDVSRGVGKVITSAPGKTHRHRRSFCSCRPLSSVSLGRCLAPVRRRVDVSKPFSRLFPHSELVLCDSLSLFLPDEKQIDTVRLVSLWRSGAEQSGEFSGADTGGCSLFPVGTAPGSRPGMREKRIANRRRRGERVPFRSVAAPYRISSYRPVSSVRYRIVGHPGLGAAAVRPVWNHRRFLPSMKERPTDRTPSTTTTNNNNSSSSNNNNNNNNNNATVFALLHVSLSVFSY